MEDRELLQAFQQDRESAFRTLVARHAGLVMAAARRQVRDPALADDVAQAVFLVLLQKAPQLARKQLPTLAPWLLRVTWYCARDALKAQRRREYHEQEAAAMRPNPAASVAWEEVEARLDAALNHLGEADRTVLVLRYFEDRTIEEVGRMLGITKEGSHKRLQCALERLRAAFDREKVNLAGGALAGMLGEHRALVVPPVDPVMAANLAAGALHGGAPVSMALAKGVLQMMRILQLKMIGAAGASVLIAASAAVWISAGLGAATQTPAGAVVLPPGVVTAPANSAAGAGTDNSASAQLPAEVLTGLKALGAAINPIEVAWMVKGESDLTIPKFSVQLKMPESLAANMLSEQSFTFLWQSGKFYGTHQFDGNQQYRLSRIDSLNAFNGSIHAAGDRAGPRPLLRNSLETLRKQGGDDAIYANNQYFDCAGLQVPTRVGELAAKKPPMAELLWQVEHGAQVSKVESREVNGEPVIRITLLAENTERRNALKADPEAVRRELRSGRNSAEYIQTVLDAIKARQNLPEKWVYLYELMPQKGYAMRERLQRYEDGRILERARGQDFQQVKDRPLWLPQTVVVESFTVPTQPEVVSPKALFRQTYQVKAVQTAAQPEEKFTPPDPPASTRPATVR